MGRSTPLLDDEARDAATYFMPTNPLRFMSSQEMLTANEFDLESVECYRRVL
jgi:hypothetical protein